METHCANNLLCSKRATQSQRVLVSKCRARVRVGACRRRRPSSECAPPSAPYARAPFAYCSASRRARPFRNRHPSSHFPRVRSAKNTHLGFVEATERFKKVAQITPDAVQILESEQSSLELVLSSLLFLDHVPGYTEAQRRRPAPRLPCRLLPPAPPPG